MSDNTTPEGHWLGRMADRAAIADIVHLYCHAIDRRRWDLLAEVFHADARYRFGSIAGGWRDFAASARATIDPMGPTHHQVGNMLTRLEGDVAHAETYFTARHWVPADYPPGLAFAARGVAYGVVIGGRYVDRFERRGDEWRIAERVGLFDWRQESPMPEDLLRDVPPDARGRFGDADPSLLVTRR